MKQNRNTMYSSHLAMIFLVCIGSKYKAATEEVSSTVQGFTPDLHGFINKTEDIVTRDPYPATEEKQTLALAPFPTTENKATFNASGSMHHKNENVTVPVSKTQNVETSSRKSEVQKKWEKTEKVIEEMSRNAVRRLLPIIVRYGSNLNISSACLGSGLKLLNGISHLKEWAIRMIDASAKPPGGIFTGTFSDFGSYDECVNIVVNQAEKQLFTGSYCTVGFRPFLPPKPKFYSIDERLNGLEEFGNKTTSFVMKYLIDNAPLFYFLSFRLGVCVPSTCGKEDMENIASAVSQYAGLSSYVDRCSVKEELSLSTGQIVVIGLLGTILVLLTASTVLELYYIWWKDQPIQKQGQAVQLMTTFSVYSNAKNLFNVSSSSKTLRALHGMKVFSINWVILGHTYIYVNFQAFRNLERTADFRSDFAFQVICNGFLSVDTFFFLSGFLVMYTTMESVKKTNGRFSVPIFLLHRYIRLTPTFMIVTASVLLLPLLGSGPVWHDVLDEQVDMCKKWWWKNVAFVNNFIGRIDQTCLHHTWYLCCDMQLFVLSLLVIIPLVKNKTVIGIFMNIAFVLASALSLALVTHFKQLPPSALFVNPDLRQQEQFARNVYFLPYTHLGPFAIGLLLGYAYWKHPQVKFSNNVKILGWLLAVTFGMASVYGVYSWNNGAEQHRPAVVLYAATHRIAWTLGVAWVTIVCITGQGGIVNKILSWKCLIPLSRITLEVYLIHPLFQWVYMAALHDRIDANHYTFLYMYLGHLLIVYVVAVVCCLAFDTPFYRLEKMLLTGKFKKNEESSKL